MRRTMRNSLALLVFLAVALWTLPAVPDHPGRYTPSPESISQNMKRNRQILWIAGEGMITRRPW